MSVSRRDNFSVATKELLAKRVGYLCSNPKCRQLTSGPQEDPGKTVNLGVASHITAAAPGGPRYRADLTLERRADSSNGIWLCQNCAKLVDNDPNQFDIGTLESWKRTGERAAAAALVQGDSIQATSTSAFAKIEQLMPRLLEEMCEDLREHPATREFIVMRRAWTYNSGGRSILVYYLDDHENLEGQLDVLCNLGLAREITYNNVRRYVFEEELVEYLCAL